MLSAGAGVTLGGKMIAVMADPACVVPGVPSRSHFCVAGSQAAPLVCGPEPIIAIWLAYTTPPPPAGDRKSTRLNSSHVAISEAVFCLKNKKKWCGCSPGSIEAGQSRRGQGEGGR